MEWREEISVGGRIIAIDVVIRSDELASLLEPMPNLRQETGVNNELKFNFDVVMCHRRMQIVPTRVVVP